MTDPASVVIAAEPIDSDDARRLIAELDGHLSGVYPPEETFFALTAQDTTADRGVFLVLRLGRRPAACGAIRMRSPSEAEVKRMYVVPSARGRGLSRMLLAELETRARTLGARRIVLETGDRQVAALGLYESAGYSRIPCFGEYVVSSSSICLGKALADQPTQGPPTSRQ